MKPARGRSAVFSSRRWLGVGAGVLVVTLAAGARGPVTGSLDAFVKTPSRLPMTDVVIPEVELGTRLPVERPTNESPSDGLADQAVGSMGIPAPALRAYRNAETIMRDTSPSCGLTWEILAGIGRVESDHGRFGGAVVGEDGVSSPQIYGVPLNGVGDVAAISDSDAGSMDGDQVWDRAVGPLQFLPTTWDLVGVDGDQDGVSNPHDLDDAALAAAVYLCAGDVDLADPEQLREALWRYNPSQEYVDLVLSYIEAYREGDPYPVDATTTTDSTTPNDSGSDPSVPFSQPTDDGPPFDFDNGGNDGDNGDNGGDNDGNNDGDNGGDNDGDGGNDGPNGGGDNDGNGGDQDPDGVDPQNPGGEYPHDPPDEDPHDPSGEDPQDPDPDPKPTTLTGDLRYNDATGWRLSNADGDYALDVGSDETLARTSSTDYDSDQDTTETVREELMGLVGWEDDVTLDVEWTSDTVASVRMINGDPYPPAETSEPSEEPTPTEPSPTEPTP